MRIRCNVTLLVGVFLVTLTTGCKKKVAVTPPAPTPVQEVTAPTPKAPFASITAEPSKIEPGQAVTLKWIATDATEVAISELGLVAVEGKQEVRPVKSTTYELVAKGPGGAVMAYATVDVVAAPPLIMIAPPPLDTRSLEQRLEAEVADLYFDYDRSDIREDASAVLAKECRGAPFDSCGSSQCRCHIRGALRRPGLGGVQHRARGSESRVRRGVPRATRFAA